MNIIEVMKNKLRLESIDGAILGVFGGMAVSLGGLGSAIICAEVALMSSGFAKFLGAVIFPVGIVMIMCMRFELFTSNVLTVSCVSEEFKITDICTFLTTIWLANLIGAIIVACLSTKFGVLSSQAIAYINNISQHKMQMSVYAMFTKAVFCNILVCIATVMGVKRNPLFAWIPVGLFVICGFEHSIANMFYFACHVISDFLTVNVYELVTNLIVVTVGNIVGGIIVSKLLKYVE